MLRITTRKLVLLAIIVQAHVAIFAASSSVAGDPPPPATTNDAVTRALNQLTRIDFREVPIRGGAEFLAAQHSIPINVDKGVGDVAITLKLDGVKLREALKLMLTPHGLDYAVVSGTVLIRVKKKP